MNADTVNDLVVDLVIVLAAGFLSGIVCKRVGVSLLVGYLAIGALIGEGGLELVSQANHELEYLARAGALLLLFSVGLEFSIGELLRLGRFFAVGGSVQMLLVVAPMSAACLLIGLDWKPALLIGAAGALSSTILVFKALDEWDQTATPHGRRAIGILLFQDVALVPLILLIPLLTGVGAEPTIADFGWLSTKSLAFVVAVVLLRRALARWIIPLLANLRSVELVVLFSIAVLVSACWIAFAIGLPPALGALAAGLMLSGNRLSKQIDTLVLPFRETFAAVFFVTLGTLLHPLVFLDDPLLLTVGLIGVLALKSVAALLALRLTGLSCRTATGMGIGLAQLGEFSFLLLTEATTQGVITPTDYNRMLFIALGTLILTPLLVKYGLRWTDSEDIEEPESGRDHEHEMEHGDRALVIGIGPAGGQIALRLNSRGMDVRLIDLNPINLHPFSHQGFHVLTGDARDQTLLREAISTNCRLAVVCVRDDRIANQIVRALRELTGDAYIVVRCRFDENVGAMQKAGADAIVSEEEEASSALLDLCEKVFDPVVSHDS